MSAQHRWRNCSSSKTRAWKKQAPSNGTSSIVNRLRFIWRSSCSLRTHIGELIVTASSAAMVYLDHSGSILCHRSVPQALTPWRYPLQELCIKSEMSTHYDRGLYSWSTVISTADWTAGHPHVAGHQVERSWPCILAITERIVNRSQSPPHVSERITRRSSEWCHVMFALWQECAADQGTSLLNWCFTGNLHSS